MKLYENYIELSDKHVMWDMHNSKLSNIEAEGAYNLLVAECLREFKDIYGREIALLGRSGRHVCVANDPFNRQSHYRMTRTIERQQKWLIKVLNSLEKFDDLKKHLKYYGKYV